MLYHYTGVKLLDGAPSAEELLADGAHIGTQSSEIGDPRSGIERARGVELVARLSGTDWRLDASVYHTRFSGYIYEFETGEIIEDLPVFRFAQGEATYRGFEIERQATLTDGLVDAVRASIDDFGPAPRIPPLRLAAGVEARADQWGVRFDAERTTRQTRTSGFETETPGFTLVNLSADWKPWTDRDVRITLSASHLLDTEARRHASFLKDFAPLAGRDIRLGVSAAI
jgi:iron complex outermembrane receptor protein